MALPDPPADMGGPPRAFYDELRQMITAVHPKALDPIRSDLAHAGDIYEITLAHRHRPEWDIGAWVDDSEITIAVAATHEHFNPPPVGEPSGTRSWTTQAVDFVAELFRGEVELRTTYRGGSPVSVTQTADGGHEQSTGYLTPSRLMVWRRKRTAVERVSFEAAN